MEKIVKELSIRYNRKEKLLRLMVKKCLENNISSVEAKILIGEFYSG